MSEEQNAKQNIIIKGMQKDIEYIKESMDEIKGMFKNHIDDCNKKFASKWTEKAIAWTIVAIMGSLIGYGMSRMFV